MVKKEIKKKTKKKKVKKLDDNLDEIKDLELKDEVIKGKETSKMNNIDEDNKELKKDKKDKRGKELYWIFGFMIAIVVIFLISQSFFKGLRNFDYEGLNFQKVKVGDLSFYYYYYFTEKTITGYASKELHRINLYLYNDPRKNNVPVAGQIVYPEKYSKVYMSTDTTELYKCKYFGVATTNLIFFLTGNQFDVEAATVVPSIAEEVGMSHITCENTPDDMVIEIKHGEETKIKRKSMSCYEITVKDCEVLEAVEKFMVQTLLDAKEIMAN